ncbi:MAG: hypothetical protein IJ497_12180 [Clostridia bacterium]|nr:hypothetical protein [Clostridia bacterium]MBQ8513367.1 hypothetical protein [Clostridia bacterium]
MKKRLLSLLLLSFLLLSCVSGSYSTVMSVENNTGDLFSMSYSLFSGEKKRSVSLNEDETEIAVVIETQSGTLDITITDEASGTSVYRGTDLPSSEFSVTVQPGGTYSITVHADHHCGSYDFSW